MSPEGTLFTLLQAERVDRGMLTSTRGRKLHVCQGEDILWAVDLWGFANFLSEDDILLSPPTRIVDARSGHVKHRFQESVTRLTCGAISPNGIIVLGAQENRWYTYKGGVRGIMDLEEPVENHGAITAAAFSTDGTLLALGMAWGNIRLLRCQLDPESEFIFEELTTLHGHFDQDVSAVAFQGNNRLLSASRWDATVRIWDISAIVQGREFQVDVPRGVWAEASWFKDYIQLGGWFTGGKQPEPFLLEYPFPFPHGVEPLSWKIDPHNVSLPS